MSRHQLAICVPTFNRSRMLRHLLQDLTEQAERIDARGIVIVVSDNASTDDTQAVIAAYRGTIPLHAIRQRSNTGGYNNLENVYRSADADYCVYCADDDKIDINLVRKIVQEMEETPQVGAVYCPWMIESGHSGARRLSYFKTIDTTLFKKGDFKPALTTILDNVLFPEIAVFRKDAVKNLPPHSDVAFWFFLVFYKVLRDWDVVIKDQSYSYYTSYLDHPAGARDGVQMGNAESASAWDTYRGGMETFVQAVNGRVGLTPLEHVQFSLKINLFVASRQIVAMRSQCTMGNYVAAFFLAQRIRLYLPEQVHDRYLWALQVGAAVEMCYTRHFGAAKDRKAVLVGEFPRELGALIKQHGHGWFVNAQTAGRDVARISWDPTDDERVLSALSFMDALALQRLS